MQATWEAVRFLSFDERNRVLRWLIEKSGESGLVSGATGAMVAAAAPTSIDPKRFLVEKRPASDVERIACLAYLHSKLNDDARFATRTLAKLNVEARQPAFGNASQGVKNALAAGFVARAGGGLRIVSASGEAFVEALPGREKARAAFEAVSLPAKKRKR